MPDEDAISEANQEHILEAKKDKLAQRAREVGFHHVSPLLVQSLTKANQVDLAMIVSSEGSPLGHTGMGRLADFGIGRVLLNLAAHVEATAQNTDQLTSKMDEKRNDSFYLASNNMSSLENVGSHSLMAKDSVRKQPLRKQADDFARFAVTTTMRVLAMQVSAGEKIFVDWGDFLRRLMCHPLQAPGDWARKAIPTDKPTKPVPPKTFEPERISPDAAEKQRLAGDARRRAFEKTYLDLATRAETDWRKLVQ